MSKRDGFQSVLVTIATDQGSKNLEIMEPSFFVGRSPDSAVRLEDPNVSRTHLQVTCTEKHVFVTDQKSANGTYVNGSKIQEFKPVPLQPGDQVVFGKTNFVVSFELKTSGVAKSTDTLASPAPPRASSRTETTMPPMPAPTNFERPPRQEAASVFAPKPVEPESVYGKVYEAPKPREYPRPATAAEPQRAPQAQAPQPSENFRSQAPQNIESFRSAAPAVDPFRQAEIERQAQARADELLAVARTQANNILSDSRKQAAQMIFEAEEKAFEASQAVFKKAEEIKKAADQEARMILERARNEAENIHSEQLNAGKEILTEARRKAESMREKIVEDAVEKAKDEINERLGDLINQKNQLESQVARASEDLKSQLAELEDTEKQVTEARSDMKNIDDHAARVRSELQQMEAQKSELFQDIEKYQSTKTELEQQVHRMNIERTVSDEKVLMIRKEIQELDDIVRKREEEISVKRQTVDQMKNEMQSMELEYSKAKTSLAESEERDRSLKLEFAETERKKLDIIENLKSLEIRKEDLTREVSELEGQRDAAEKTFDVELKEIKRKHEIEYEKVKSQSEQKLQYFVQEEAKKAEQLRAQMMRDLQKYHESLSNEIHQKVWTVLLQDVPSETYKRAKKPTLQIIQETISNKLMGNVTDELTNTELQSLQKKSNRQQLNWAMTGFIGALVVGGVLWLWQETLRSKTFAGEAEEQRLSAERERSSRKFQPEQDIHVRENYVDSVIYTKDFVGLYADNDVHGRWVKEASDYLFKQWRIEEEKAIEVVAMAKSLVNELNQRKRDIHPDFVKENIEKMRASENAVIGRMKETLGTNVKFEAFKKFETKFFSNEIYRRQPASQK